MVKILGMEYAPLNIPLHRRIETFCVFQWVCTFLFAGFGCLGLFIYLLFTRYYWISFLYLGWYVYDTYINDTANRGARPISFIRHNIVWKYMAQYFPAKLHKTVDLDPKKSFIFGLHPHGILHTSGFLSFASEGTGFSKLFPGIMPHLLILAGQFEFPFYRDYLLTSGMASVSRDSFRWILTHPGHVACVVVGGAVEALEARPGCYNLVLHKRKGFIKQALRYGASLVPVFHFGEVDIFNQAKNPEGSFLKKLQQFLTHYVTGFSPPLIIGRGVFNYSFGIIPLPYRRPINTVVGAPVESTGAPTESVRLNIGAPIDCEKCEEPSQEEVDALHDKYMKGLVQLFEDNKTKYGLDESVHLNFIG